MNRSSILTGTAASGTTSSRIERGRFRGRRVAALTLGILLLTFGATSVSATPCARDASVDCTTFASGSLIIPMDTTYQNYGMWKAYGLVYRLLQNNIPVYWVIWPNQTSPWTPPAPRTVDLTLASGSDLKTGAALTTGFPNYGYTGGPFVIDSAYAAQAETLINTWWSQQGGTLPVVHEATAPFEAPVSIRLTHAPMIAIESINGGIATAYLNAAGIPNSAGTSWTTTSCWSTSYPPVQTGTPPACNPDMFNEERLAAGHLFKAGVCDTRLYDIFITPHNDGYDYSLTDPTDVATRAYAQLDNFVNQGGGWIALCHSVLSNENAIHDLLMNGSPTVKSLFKFYQDGNIADSGFLTTDGFSDIANESGIWRVDEPDLPIGQVVRTTPTQALPGGSVQTWDHSTVTYLPGVERIAYFDAGTAQYDHVINGVYHGGVGRGKLSYLGGHSYSTSLPYLTNFEAPYLRMFYNALFFNGAAVAKLSLVPSKESVRQGQSTVDLAINNTGASTASVAGAITVTIQPGLTYLGTSGATPTSAPPIGSSAGGTLVWASPGLIPGGSTYSVVHLATNYPNPGSYSMGTLSASYGDVFGEAFQAKECAAITVRPTPAPAITKTTSSPTPFYPGHVVTWNIGYSNPGSGALLNPVIEDILPSQLAFSSAVPAPNSVIPVPGGTKLVWNLASPLAAGGSGTITLRASIQTATGQPFTNTVTLTGSDSAGVTYTATASSTIFVNTPELTGTKSVFPAGPVDLGTTLTYTLTPYSSGPGLIEALRIFDAPPLNTTYVAGTAGPSPGTFGAYPPLPALNGIDDGPSPSTTMAISAGTTPFTYAVGATLTVSMTLTNRDPNTASGYSINNVTATLTPSDGSSSCVPLSAQPVASIPKNFGTAVITFTCTVNTLGEISWDGNATGTYLGTGAPYDFPTATSSSALGVSTSTGTQVVYWTPAESPTSPISNTAAIPTQTYGAQMGPGLFEFPGGTSSWERYDIANNSWVNGANALPGATGPGAALVYDGLGYTTGGVYALRGAPTTDFWRYAINVSPATSGSWVAMAPTPAPVGEGGALTRIGTTIYALRGGNTSDFWAYDINTNSWSTKASIATPIATALVKAGGALTSDGTYVYAFMGNGKNKFYRYDPAANTWSVLPNAPWGTKTGAGLTYLNGVIYGMGGGGSNNFSKYVIATNKWTNLKSAPSGFNAGGAVTTDGTSIWAMRGNNNRAFWRYNIATNTWTVLANTNANVNAGGALAWVPSGTTASNTNAAKAAPVLVTATNASPATITVTQTITSNVNVNNVVPSITAATVNGVTASASNCAVSPAGPQSVSKDVPFVFTWTCTAVTPGGVFGSVTYSTSATATGTSWTSAAANSVLVTPPLTYQTKVASSTDATQIPNVAIVSQTVGGAPFNAGTNTVITPLLRPAAVSSIKSVVPTGIVHPGDILTYSVVIQNTTSNPTANITLSDVVPTGTTYVGGSCAAKAGSVPPATPPSTFGSCSFSAGTVSFTGGNLGAYGAAVFTFQVTVNTPPSAVMPPGSTISNFATYQLNGGAATPTNTVTNTLIAVPILSIEKFQANPTLDENGYVLAGSQMTYTLQVTNSSLHSVPASNLVVSDQVPTGTAYVSCAGGGSCSESGGLVTWNIATLAPGATTAVTLVVLVTVPGEYGSVVSNSGSVTATEIPTPIQSNIVTVSLKAYPNLTISKTSCPDTSSIPSGSYQQVVPGETITYRIRAKNLDPDATANLIGAFVSDVIPAGTTYVAGSTWRVNPADDAPCSSGAWPASMPSWLHVADLSGQPPLPSAVHVHSFPLQYRGDTPDGGTLATETADSNENDAIIQFQVTVNSGDTVNGTPIDNAATAGASTPINSNPDPQYSTTSNTLRHLIYTTPNVTITKSVTPTGTVPLSYPDPNDPMRTLWTELKYTLLLTNSGTHSVTLAVMDQINTGLVVYPATVCNTAVSPTSCTSGVYAPDSTWNPATSTITWPSVTLPAGGTSTLTFTVNPRADMPAGSYTIVNSATTSAWTHYASAVDPGVTAPSQSNQVVNIVLVPTVVELVSFGAEQNRNDVLITWRTEWEAENLGYNVYREEAGVRTLVNRELIAGGMLVGRRTLLAGYSYRLRDRLTSEGAFVQYWLEDIDVHGVQTLHGPITPALTSEALPESNTAPLSGLGAEGFTFISAAGRGTIQPLLMPAATTRQKELQLEIAADDGLKIFATQEGWYRITRAEMIEAGYDPGAETSRLGLYCGGIEQKLLVDTGRDGKLDLSDFVEFYALGLDTTSTGARTYWLRSKGRLRHTPGAFNGRKPPVFNGSVAFTAERYDRAFFVPWITSNEGWDNWAGLIITTGSMLDRNYAPISFGMTVANLDTRTSANATLEVVIQGITDGTHLIDVSLNGRVLGTAVLGSQNQKTFTYTFPASWLIAGTTPISLTSRSGSGDLCTLQRTRLTYPHLLRADDGLFEAALPAASTITVGGFPSANIRVLDVSDVLAPVALDLNVAAEGATFSATFATASSTRPRTILAVSADRFLGPPELVANQPSSWSSSARELDADMIVLTNGAFLPAAQALEAYRDTHGVATTVIDVEDVYDEVSFGIRSPQAIRTFLDQTSLWRTPPQFVTLVGDASFDPRDYLGMGSVDFMPTRLVNTAYIRASSDDWLTDFDDDGIADVPIGRLPVRNLADAQLVVTKILSRSTSGSPMDRAVFIADANSTYDFEASIAAAMALVPDSLVKQQIRIGKDASPRSLILSALNTGALLVDFVGHGSTEVWASHPLFYSSNAMALTNGNNLPFVVSMTCLNGHFHDLFTESLAEAFLKAPHGGAAAVWASSTLTLPNFQDAMNRELMLQLFGTPGVTIGEATMRAKQAVSDRDVRLSWILFGDPSMPLR